MADRDSARSIPIIAIDGPGGAGKGTVSHAVANRLGWHLLDSGALYRLIAFEALSRRCDLGDESGLTEIARTLDVIFKASDEGEKVILSGNDVSSDIRAEECGRAASRIAAIPAVRAALVARQRGFRQAPGLVADGRDVGSVIFPDAGLKIFLTADVEERARRRYKQLKDKGIGVSLPALSSDMVARDRRDAERAVAPLQASEDARILDTTRLTIEEVVQTVLRWAAEAYPGEIRE